MIRRSLVMCAAMAIAIAFAPRLPAQQGAAQDVRKAGAIGDGKSKDTAAFQKAIDNCASAGGGEVVVPAGQYMIGSIALKSNTTLRLEKDATLTGTDDLEDYPII